MPCAAYLFQRSYSVSVIFKLDIKLIVVGKADKLAALPGEGIEVDSRGIADVIVGYRRAVEMYQQVAPAISVGVIYGRQGQLLTRHRAIHCLLDCYKSRFVLFFSLWRLRFSRFFFLFIFSFARSCSSWSLIYFIL